MPLPRYDPSVVDWRAVLARFGILFPPLILVLGAAVMAVHLSQERALEAELGAEESRRAAVARDAIVAAIDRIAADARTSRGTHRLDADPRSSHEALLRCDSGGSTDGEGAGHVDVSVRTLWPVADALAGDDESLWILDPWGVPITADKNTAALSLPTGEAVEPSQSIGALGVWTTLPLPSIEGVSFVARGSERTAPTTAAAVHARIPPTELERRVGVVRAAVWRLFAFLATGMVVATWFVARYAAQRDQSSRRAFQAERLAAIGEAMTGLAHESRNAIQRGQASIEMLAKRVQHVPDAPLHLERLQQAQEDLHQLYERVRSYAAPVPLNRQLTELDAVLDTAWNDLESLRRERAVALNVEHRGSNTFCHVDPFAIRRVFCNVLENALSVENDEGIDRERVEIDVTFSDARLSGRDAIEVSIRDNGPGLSAEQMRRIFEPFYTTRSRGTGLGMAITRRLVEMHGGTIRAAPDSANGAHFVITLPREPT